MQLKDKRKKQNRKAKKSIVFIWLITYLCVLFIPFFAGSMIHIKMNNMYSEELFLYNNLSVNNALLKVEGALDEAQKLSVDLAKNQQLFSLKTSMPNDNDAFYKVELLREFLMQKKESASKYISLYVYINSLDKVVYPEGTNSGEIFVYNNYSSKESFLFDWREKMSQIYNNKYLLLENDKRINLMQSVPIGDRNNFFANIVISVDFDMLFSQDGQSSIRGYSTAILLDKNDNIMFSTQYISEDIKEKVKMALLKKEETILSGKEKFKVTNMQSAKHGWSLLVLEPQKLFWGKIYSINKLFALMYAFCLVFGLAAIYFIIRWQYKPIKSLLTSFSGKNVDKKDFNIAEYRDIHNKIGDVILRTNAIEKKNFTQNRMIKLHALQKMIDGDVEALALTYKDYLEELKFNDECFATIKFSLLDYEELFHDEKNLSEQKKVEIANIVIANIGEEIIGSKFVCYIFEYDSDLASIINYSSEEGENFHETLSEMLNQMNRFIKNNFYIEYRAAVGIQTLDISQVYSSYEKASQAMDYLLFKKSGSFVFYDDVREFGSMYYYPLQKEMQLFSCLENGDKKNVRTLLDEIFMKNENVSLQGQITIKRLIYSLINTLINGCGDDIPNLSEEIFDTDGEMEKLLKCKNLKAVQERINSLFEKCCDKISQNRESASSNIIVKKVIDYVKDNYMDYDISVSIIAQKLDIHPYYLSTSFKKNTGIGLLEYINRQKIEKAKELLIQNKSITLEKLASEVGFSNYRSLLRVFKKYTGVSPGEYKEMNYNFED